MKIGILTYYGVFNHGAVLQANALKLVLESLGHKCSFIKFNRNYDMIPQDLVRKYEISFKSIFFYIKYFFEKGLRNVLFNLNKHHSLNEYKRKNFTFDSIYTYFEGDAVVIGSDEVFSIEIGINPFFYGHGIRVDKFFSYAASFGPTTIDMIEDANLSRLISSGLRDFDTISTRDKNSRDIIFSLTNREAALVCDPVILYGYEQEMQYFQPNEKDYILLYSYEKNFNDKEEISAIRDYAKQKGKKVYSIAYYHSWCDKNIKSNPDELLGWFKNAALIVTDTFHGSVLAIICNTPMVVKVRGNGNKVLNLMEEYNLEYRVIENNNQFHQVADEKIDFNEVNDLVDFYRKKSMQYLRKALDD